MTQIFLNKSFYWVNNKTSSSSSTYMSWLNSIEQRAWLPAVGIVMGMLTHSSSTKFGISPDPEWVPVAFHLYPLDIVSIKIS